METCNIKIKKVERFSNAFPIKWPSCHECSRHNVGINPELLEFTSSKFIYKSESLSVFGKNSRCVEVLGSELLLVDIDMTLK